MAQFKNYNNIIKDDYNNDYNNDNTMNNVNPINKKNKIKPVLDYVPSIALSDKQMTKMERFIQRHYILVNVLVIGLFLYCYYLDIEYKTFSMKNWVTKIIPNKYLNSSLKIFGAYGLIQVFAQDVGVKTGKNQRNFVQSSVIQFIIYWAAAYALTDDRSEALFGTVLYFILKYIFSNNETSLVCFEKV